MTTVPWHAQTGYAGMAGVSGRRRRPSGEPPPLPRHLSAGTVGYLIVVAFTVLLWAALLFEPALRAVTGVDDAILRLIAGARTGALTSVMRGVDNLSSSVVTEVAAWLTIGVLVLWRRFPHLLVYLVALVSASFVELIVGDRLARMRPAGLAILDHWQGYANPSRPVSGLAAVLAGMVFTLAPAGVWRRRAGAAAAAMLAMLCVSRLYLAVDHPTDVLAGLAVGWALPALLFRVGTPDEAFPVTYRWGSRAHVDVGNARGEAIRRALAQQLGAKVDRIEPFGLGGSAGSTPLRLQLEEGHPGEPTVVFGKLYALCHLRSDRLYKLVRSIRYGRLEDERPFATVRRLVEYEDHLLRLFRDLGLPTPKPYGFAEISPEREYLIVMEFLDGARELNDTTVTDSDIDQGLAIVRTMWDAGVAHRDIKPSNLLLAGDRVILIDLAFGAVRPSPWRQAVDLANMMLTLGLASTAERVYRRALLRFTPDDIAEAFAASRGVTIPSQLRGKLRADGRDLVAQFRRLAPPRRRLPVQRWTLRRAATTLAAMGVTAFIVWGALVFGRTAGLL